ncbi:MAG: molecular chaperone DnaJ [Candidatus Omnitrophica bacterium]|nr:molecular chaperone DnaJ [Candidatus Omnitrophota bacterium]
MTKRDYYEILGVGKDAAVDDIKKTYRKLAMKYHPDRAAPEKHKESEEKFKEISEAYAVLSDEKKRAQYDRFGHAGINNQYSSEDIFRGADFSSIFEDIGFGGGGIFEDLFSGFGFSGSRPSSRGSRRGADLEYELLLSFEEAAKGIERTIAIKRGDPCPACKGNGAQPGTKRITCPGCRGSGQVGQSAGFFTIARTCDSCHGEGEIITAPCKKCQGRGKVLVERKINITIPAGVDNGSHLRVRGEGEAGTKGGPRGELYILIRLKPNKVFERHGNDVICKVPISFVQAAMGTEIEVPGLYEEKIKMKIPAGTQNEKVFRISGKGFPDLRGHSKGDQYIRVHVTVPTSLSSEQKKLLIEFSKLSDENPKNESITEKIKNAFK